jgi:hypothetical protein
MCLSGGRAFAPDAAPGRRCRRQSPKLLGSRPFSLRTSRPHGVGASPSSAPVCWAASRETLSAPSTSRARSRATAPASVRRSLCKVLMPASPVAPTLSASSSAAAVCALLLRNANAKECRAGSASEPPFPLSTAPRPGLAVSKRASRFTRRRATRVRNVQQDDHRRLPPGRDPGGGSKR